MSKEIVHTSKAARPVGPYSQVVKAGGFIFISGQISSNPQTGELIQGDAGTQTKNIMTVIKDILEDAGSGMSNVVKCNIYLSDAMHFEAMNKAYASFFDNDYPARLTVSGVRIFGGMDVEIDVIATA